MTRRPKTAKARPQTRRAKLRKSAKPARPVRRDPLDAFIAAGAQALDLKIAKSWMPAVRGNLAVTLRLARQFTGFALPDDAEPAPVFKA